MKAVVALDDEEVIYIRRIWFICDGTYTCEDVVFVIPTMISDPSSKTLVLDHLI